MGKTTHSFSRQQGYLSTIGLTLVFSIFIGTGIGLFLDKLFDTKPWLMFVFLLMGIVSGFYNIFRVTKALNSKQKTNQ